MSPAGWGAFVVAGAVGAALRAAIFGRVPVPWGTFLVNVTGSMVFGFLSGLALYHALPERSFLVLGTGFTGAYTTFSAFTFETVRLIEEGAVGRAFRNAAGTVLTCGAAAAAGLGLAAL